AVTLPILLYFTWNRALSVFWQDAFLFNFGWYTQALKETFFQHLIKLKTLVDAGNYAVTVLVTVTLGFSAALFPSANRKLILLALLAVPLSVVTEFMGGRDIVPQLYKFSYTHYVLPLAGSIPILLFCVFAFTREPVLSGYRAQGIFSFLVCALLVYTALQHVATLKRKELDQDGSAPELPYLRQQQLADYQFYVFGSTSSIYISNELNVRAPSVWIYHHFWSLYPGWDAGLPLLRGIKQDLLRHRTTFILDLSAGADWFRDPSADAEWHGFLRDNYQPVMENTRLHSILWRRKDTR
ncbi:MAG TPA: hypothetical protein VNW04_19155, partial [Puia sp.]|nr:hypothetical protein [Puia sp.]